MKFSIESISKNSGRLGCITKPNGHGVKTPLLLQYTRGGSVPHLSREVYDYLNNQQKALEFSVENTVHMNDSLRAYKRGLASFSAFDDHITFATLRDTGTIYKWFHSQEDVSIITKAGKIALNAQQYMDTIELIKPDIFHTLCDGDTSENCAKKRIHNAANRTRTFLEACVERFKTSEALKDSLLIAPIEGGYNIAAREQFIRDLQIHGNHIGGYFLDGLHNGAETASNLNVEKVKDVVAKCVHLLEKNKLRCMLGAFSPLLTLELIQMGIDVFDTSFAYITTQKNRALVFRFNISEQNTNIGGELSIDLMDSIYKDDFQPYLESCQCLACQKHTKAYTQHLLKTNELLGPILLMIHNTHHYLEFFKTIRNAMVDDSMPKLVELVAKQSVPADIPLNIITK